MRINLSFIKRLLKSDTVKGILAAAIGAAIDQSRTLLTPEIMAQYGVAIQVIAGILEAGGAGVALRGRMKAKGPIEADPGISS